VVGDGTTGRCGAVSGETCVVGGERRRSQSPRSTAAVKAARGAGSKAAPREGRIGRWKREFHDEAKRKPSAGSVRKDYTRRRDPRPGLVVGGSFGVE
jgi:hypothetical protein